MIFLSTPFYLNAYGSLLFIFAEIPFQFSAEQEKVYKFIFSSCYITRLSKCCKRIDIKKKQEKTVTVAKGFHLLTNIFERLVPPHFTIIILMTQAVCGT